MIAATFIAIFGALAFLALGHGIYMAYVNVKEDLPWIVWPPTILVWCVGLVAALVALRIVEVGL